MSDLPAYGEKRYVTIMDLDIKGSTLIDAEVGQELGSDVKLAVQDIAADAIVRNLGTFDSWGDGYCGVFGLEPTATTSVVLALLAAREILAALEAPAGRVAELPLRPRVRIGIHCGLTLFRSGRVKRADHFGLTPAVAARLQSDAPENTILLSEDAFASVRHYVRGEPLGLRTYKGLEDDPVGVVAIDPHEFRNEPGQAALEPRMVGRTNQLGALLAAVESQRGGSKPGIVQVIGPAGVGKSRLLRAFRKELRDAAALPVQCDPFEQGRAFGALATAVANSTPFALYPSATLHEAVDTVERALARMAPDPAIRVLIIDDGQFADAGTMGVLRAVAHSKSQARTLLVVAARAPVDLGATEPVYVTVSPLEPDDANELLLCSPEGKGLPVQYRLAVIARAGGNALYLQELARAASSRMQPRWRENSAIPPALWPTLAARIGQTPSQIDALRTLSLFEGPLPLPVAVRLTAVQDIAELQELEAAHVLRLRPGLEDLNCWFDHDLLRAAAYETIAPRDLGRRHRFAAETLIEEFPAFTAEHPHVVGRQLAMAGEARRAADHYVLAADRSYGFVAEGHYQTALELAEGDEELRRRLRSWLVAIQMSTRGYGNKETVGAMIRKREFNDDQ